jgi:hypothetical protein
MPDVAVIGLVSSSRRRQLSAHDHLLDETLRRALLSELRQSRPDATSDRYGRCAW